MEKKSMGSFLAALRKTRGYTQKELAEQLGVSDKSISRWERDEGVPDLSMIPVLAEFFGVTADELLRGERRAEEDRTDEPLRTPKGDKQRQRLVNAALTQYHNRTLISGGVAGVGLIAALVGNFALLKAAPGFFAGLVFLLAAAVMQGIWVNGAMLTVSDEDFTKEERVSFRRRVFRKAAGLWVLVLTLLAASLPPMLNLPDPAHTGLSGGQYFQSALVLCGVVLALCAVIVVILDRTLHLFTEPGSLERMTANDKLKRKLALILLAAVAVTFLLETAMTGGWDPANMARGIVFEDYSSFTEYMEQDLDFRGMPRESDEPFIYYDENENVISEEEAIGVELRDKDENLLCSYMARNDFAAELRYGPEKDGYLPIEVVTRSALTQAMERGNQLMLVFGLLYAAEAVTVLAVYARKRIR